jgi:hypothetical protein
VGSECGVAADSVLLVLLRPLLLPVNKGCTSTANYDWYLTAESFDLKGD